MENQNNSQSQSSESKVDKGNSTVMGVLSYLGILVVIPLIMSKKDPFVKFHIKQGLVLAVAEIILWFAIRLFWILSPLIALLDLGVLILSIIGIINVIQNKEKELPLVGSFSKYVNFNW